MYGFVNTGIRELIGLQTSRRGTKRVRLSRRFRQRIYWRDGGCCAYCGKAVSFKQATIDHVVPLVQRGKNRSKENIVTACKPCNDKKGQLTLDELGDLAPESLWLKFQKATETAQRAKGSYPEWVAAHE